jgi:hypothetical protein
MNATAATILFTTNGVANVPLGAASATGHDQIYQTFAGLFGEVKYLIESVLSGYAIIPPYAAYSKLFQSGNL